MILDDIAVFLASGGAGVVDVDIHLADMPSEGELLYVPGPPESSVEAPVNVIALYESAAGPGEHDKQGLAASKARVQVLVRNETYEGAMGKALQVYGLLAHFSGSMNGTHYDLVRALHRPWDLGSKDQNGRTLVSANYDLTL